MVLSKASSRARASSVVSMRAHAFTPLVAWRIAYQMQEYGAQGGDYYHDPVREPLVFLAHLPERTALLMLGQWMSFPSEVNGMMLPSLQMGFVLFGGIVSIVVLVAIVWPLARESGVARAWLTGMVLSLLPAVATYPMNRLLFFVGLGAMGLLAQFFVYWRSRWRRGTSGPVRFLGSAFFWILVVIHLLAAPSMFPAIATSFKASGRLTHASVALHDAPEVEGRKLILISGPAYILSAQYIQALRALAGADVPSNVLMLSAGLQEASVMRLDDRTLLVRPDLGWLSPGGRGAPGQSLPPFDPGYLFQSFDRLFRGDNLPMAEGETVNLGYVEIEVTALNSHGRPAEAAFRFARPLEAEDYVWMQWNDDLGGWEPFRPPPIGQAVRMSVPNLPSPVPSDEAAF